MVPAHRPRPDDRILLVAKELVLIRADHWQFATIIHVAACVLVPLEVCSFVALFTVKDASLDRLKHRLLRLLWFHDVDCCRQCDSLIS